MDKDVGQMLFAFLRDCIYAPNKAQLDMDALPDELKSFGEGLLFLCQCLQEQKTFADALLAGDLGFTPPSVENGIAAPLKAIQGRLLHLEWQTKQVAGGDYSQKLDFMGEFSEAFNTMTRQLKERQEALERRNQELRANRELLLNLVLEATRIVVVVNLANDEMMFLSNSAKEARETIRLPLPSLCEQMHSHVPSSGEAPSEWNFTIPSEESGFDEDTYLEIKSYRIVWEGADAAAHVLTDISESRRAALHMEQIAYTDMMTGLINRRSVMNLLQDYMEKRIPFCLAFIDLDGLKYCNDSFGHPEGDQYIRNVAEKLKQIPETTVARVGGDEFIIMRTGTEEKVLCEELEEIRCLLHDESRNYLKSISYGICVYSGEEDETLAALLSAADERMYLYKFQQKRLRKRL